MLASLRHFLWKMAAQNGGANQAAYLLPSLAPAVMQRHTAVKSDNSCARYRLRQQKSCHALGLHRCQAWPPTTMTHEKIEEIVSYEKCHQKYDAGRLCHQARRKRLALGEYRDGLKG